MKDSLKIRALPWVVSSSIVESGVFIPLAGLDNPTLIPSNSLLLGGVCQKWHQAALLTRSGVGILRG